MAETADWLRQKKGEYHSDGGAGRPDVQEGRAMSDVMAGPFCLVPREIPAWALKEFPDEYRKVFAVSGDSFGVVPEGETFVGASVRVRLPYRPVRIPDDAVALVRYNMGAPGT